MTEEPLLWWLAHNTFFAAVLAAIVFLACRLGRLRPAVRHALWLVVLIKLATPPLLTWPWSTPAPWPSRPAGSAGTSPAAEAAPPARAEFRFGDCATQWRK